MKRFMGRAALAAGLLILMGTTADVARAQTIPANLPGFVTRNLYFAHHDNNGLFFVLEGASNAAYAQGNGTPYAPRLNQSGNTGRTLWFSFINGAPGQYDLFTGKPGHHNYSPIAHVIRLQWRVTPVRLTRYQDVFTHFNAGRLLAYETGALLNASVIWQDTDLNGRGGHLATTLVEGVQVRRVIFNGATPDRVELLAYPAYFNNQVVAFTDLDHADGIVPDLEGNPIHVTPVPRLGRARLGTAAVANLYGVQGQDPVVVNTVPGRSDYTPIWKLFFVRRQPGFTQVLTSEQAILAARAAGRVTIVAAGDDAVFNCPIVDPRIVQPLP